MVTKKEQSDSKAHDHEKIRDRIRKKTHDYMRYDFSWEQNALLQSFFDLAQEFDDLGQLYRIIVGEVTEVSGLGCRLYLVNEVDKKLMLVCDSERGLFEEFEPAPHLSLACKNFEKGGSFYFPIHRKPSNAGESSPIYRGMVMGLLEVFPSDKLNESDIFFLSKYANRIGYNLHNRMIAEQNIQHLKFINNLVMDIEHNVITPNMYFRHLFNQLKKRIGDMDELEEMMAMMKQKMDMPGTECSLIMDKVGSLHEALAEIHRDLIEHHKTYSLFLESLFRRDHFKKGRFVLRPTPCYIEREIITPQLEHFSSRFKQHNITIERPKDMLEEDISLSVDVGLLSQVYANLFSNAIKYTKGIFKYDGTPRKAIAYGREILKNYFGPGNDGIKFNVFTTGPHLTPQEAETFFLDGTRGEKSKDVPGTGHGLAFVKQVVEIHGGVVGFEPTPEGNNFYFILPISGPEAKDAE